MSKEAPIDGLIACAQCGILGTLVMCMHKNDEGYVVGWLYFCTECLEGIKGNDIEIKVT